MSGLTTRVSDASDPQNLRFLAAQYTVDWLSDFRSSLTGGTDRSALNVNMGVVYFGTDPVSILEWTPLETDNATWPALQEEISDDLSAGRFSDTWHLTDTDFQEAFRESESTFIGSGSLPPAGSNPLNVVVVITDGGPCTRRDPLYQYQDPNDNTITRYTCDRNNSVGKDVLGAQVSRLGTLGNFIRNNLPSTDFRYYLIALDADGSYWPELAADWESIICDRTYPLPSSDECNTLHAVRVNTAIDMGAQTKSVLRDIAERLVPTSINDACVLEPPENQCQVPPYTQLMRIDVYKTNPNPLGTQIEIRRPNGDIYAPLAPRRADTPIETNVLENPESGVWQINTADTAPVDQIVVDFIRAGVRMQPVDDLQVFEETPLELEIVDGKGEVQSVDPDFPLEMIAQAYDATLPDVDLRPAVGSPIPLTLSGTTFIGTWLPQRAGTYEIRVTATYPTPEGSAVFVRDRSVLDDLRVIGTTIDWETGGITPPNVPENGVISVKAIARNMETGAPVENTGAMQVQLTVTDSATSAVVEEVMLPNEADAAGLVEAKYAISQTGNYQVNAEVGLLDVETGNFIPLALRSPTQFVTVHASIPLTLQLLQPSEETLYAQDISLTPFTIDLDTPTIIQAQLTKPGNETVSLSTVTGGQVLLPTVTLSSGSTTDDYTSQLQEIRPGVYAVTITELPMGTYTISASVDPSQELVDYYVWARSNGEKPLNRTLHPAIPIGLGIAAVIVLASLALGMWLYRRRQSQRENALKGTLALYIKYNNGQIAQVQQIILNENVNEQNLNNLRAPYKRMKVSTHNNPQVAKAGDIYIDELEFTNAEPLRRPVRILGNGEFRELGLSEDGDMAFVVKLSSRAGDSAGANGLSSLRQSD